MKIPFRPGLKARHVKARPEGPGEPSPNISQALKGRHLTVRANPTRMVVARWSRPYRAASDLGHVSRPFGPGYHMTGFQPLGRTLSNFAGLKAREVAARPEGPGTTGQPCFKPCKGDTFAAESAPVLETIKGLLK